MELNLITNFLEEFAPLALQESYDNCGLLIGQKKCEITAAMVTLDVIEKVVDEAIQKKCNLIVAHHPLIFGGIKKLTGSNDVERTIEKAIKNNIAIYACHTNIDNVIDGVNGEFCNRLNLINTHILSPKNGVLKKLIFFCPSSHTEKVKNSIFNAGAGKIGNYDHCSFTNIGTGSYKGLDGAQPFLGNLNEIHTLQEDRIEVVFESFNESSIIYALKNSHPYEEVAFDILELKNSHKSFGSGMIGELLEETNEIDALQMIKVNMDLKILKHTQLTGKKVKKIAVCGGSGSFLIKKAISAGADLFITSDIKYHEFFDADNRLVIVDIGHFESEQHIKQLFFKLLTEKFPKFAVLISETNTNPVNYL